MKKYLILSIVAIVVALTACRNDNEADLYNGVCDTTATTYSGFLLPLLEDKCYECHSTATHIASGDGKLLEGYDNVKDFVDDGSFIGSIRHDDGFVAMPDGAAKLDACTISRIEKWIANGAQNN